VERRRARFARGMQDSRKQALGPVSVPSGRRAPARHASRRRRARASASGSSTVRCERQLSEVSPQRPVVSAGNAQRTRDSPAARRPEGAHCAEAGSDVDRGPRCPRRSGPEASASRTWALEGAGLARRSSRSAGRLQRLLCMSSVPAVFRGSVVRAWPAEAGCRALGSACEGSAPSARGHDCVVVYGY
jgi:hypothetical protein